MNATWKKRKSPSSCHIFSIPFSRPVPRIQLSRRSCIQRGSDKDGKWPTFACLFHFFNSDRSFLPPAVAIHAQPHAHGKIYTGKPPSPFYPTSLNRCLRWQKPRDRILCVLSAAAALFVVYFIKFRPRAEVFTRRCVIRRFAFPPSIKIDDTRRKK